MIDHDDPMRSRIGQIRGDPWRENHRPFDLIQSGTVDDVMKKAFVSDEEEAENDLEGDESNDTS